jgi:hypothetical protein
MEQHSTSLAHNIIGIHKHIGSHSFVRHFTLIASYRSCMVTLAKLNSFRCGLITKHKSRVFLNYQLVTFSPYNTWLYCRGLGVYGAVASFCWRKCTVVFIYCIIRLYHELHKAKSSQEDRHPIHGSHSNNKQMLLIHEPPGSNPYDNVWKKLEPRDLILRNILLILLKWGNKLQFYRCSVGWARDNRTQ